MHSPGHPSLARPTASIIHIMRCCCCTHIGRGLVFREFSFSLSTICFSSWRNNNERRAIEVPPSIEHMIAFLKLNTSNHRRVKSYAGTHMLPGCWLLGPADPRAPRGSYLHARPRPAPLGRFHTIIISFLFFRIEDFWPGRGPKIHFLSEVNLQEIAAARQMYQARREKKVVFIRTKFSGKSASDAKPSWTNYAVRSNYRVASCKDKFS